MAVPANSQPIPMIEVPAEASQPAIAVDPEGRVIVAWRQRTQGNPAVWLQRWNGKVWEPLGESARGRGVSRSVGDATNPSLAVDSAGRPALAWEDLTAGNSEIYFRRWNGADWEEAAGSGSGTGVSATITGLSVAPTLAIDSQGAPLIAWEEHYGSKSDVYVRRLESGKRWVNLGPQAGFIGFPKKIFLSTSPSMVLDNSGNPAIAYEDDSSHLQQIYLRRWQGGQWKEVGASANGGGVSNETEKCSTPSLVLDAAGTPAIVWQTGNAVRAATWTGPKWHVRDVARDPQIRFAWPSMAFDKERGLYVAFVAGSRVEVRRQNGEKWHRVHEWTIRNPRPFYKQRPMRMTAANGRLWVAWVEDAPQHGLAVDSIAAP